MLDKPVSPTFESTFFAADESPPIRIPDYQRAFAWEEKQIDQFIGDLLSYADLPGSYYFGNFIVEPGEHVWEIVDGQQRITTFVLFVMACGAVAPDADLGKAAHLPARFSTVGYDEDAFRSIGSNLGPLMKLAGGKSNKELETGDIITACGLEAGGFTRSQRRMVEALVRFFRAFGKGKLDAARIPDYLRVVMTASCSFYPAADKSVAVNVFEMYNTRGISLTTIEVIKAKLMRFVYLHGGTERTARVAEIQKEFGEIYRMEETLAEKSFRGNLTLEQLLRLHLRVVDDGTKTAESSFHSPELNADADKLIAYIDKQLYGDTSGSEKRKDPQAGVAYALGLAREFRKTVSMVAEFLPDWDAAEKLVGDVMILEKEHSCQLFLLMGRKAGGGDGVPFFRMEKADLILWERLLFTRDFHNNYHGLSHRDNFPRLYADLLLPEADTHAVILRYLRDGFRGENATKNLQKIVADYIETNRKSIFANAYYWWKGKMNYALYKYEIHLGANVRETMKGTISIEHILPQDWDWDWLEEYSREPVGLTKEQEDAEDEKVSAFINGIGNLLILTPGENSAAGKIHPAEKVYGSRYKGGSYHRDETTIERWRKSSEWSELVNGRSQAIFDFMNRELVGIPGESAEP